MRTAPTVDPPGAARHADAPNASAPCGAAPTADPAGAPIPRANPALVAAVCADAPVCVVTGHYGVGKTNLALNLALACAAAGESVTLFDLDLVNPYFRSSDYPQVLADAGVRLGAPTFAGTTLDTPSVGGRLFAETELARAEPNRRLIVDVGGDDAGATALGRYAQALRDADARVLYVANAFRNLTRDAADAVGVLREIEHAAHLSACGVVNNSHLCDETAPRDVLEGRVWARGVADAAGLPLVATCVPAHVFKACNSCKSAAEPLVGVARYVNTPWH